MLVTFHPCLSLVATVAILTIAACSNLPLEDWERALEALRGESAPPGGLSTGFDSSRAHTFAPQRSDTQDGRSGLISRYDLIYPPTSSNEAPMTGSDHGLNHDPRTLQQQSISWTQSNLPESTHHGIDLHENSQLDELSLEQKIRSLRSFRGHLYLAVQKGYVKNPIFQPFSGQLSPDKFKEYVRSVLWVRPQFGPWPVEAQVPLDESGTSFQSQRFLLHQIAGNKKILKEVNGIENNYSNKVLLGVWQEVGARDSGKFQYLGVVEGLERRNMREYRDKVLAPTAKPLADFELVGPSTIKPIFSAPTTDGSGQELVGGELD